MKNNKLPYHINSGFKVPDNYFQDFEQRIMNAVDRDKDASAALETYSGQPGFSVPPGYFRSIEDRILERVNKEPVKVIPLFSARKLFYAAAVAAVFIGVISSVFFKNNMEEHTMDSLELSALENYIEEGYYDLDFNELSAFITEEGYSFGNFSTEGFSDEAMYNYINENVEDPELLFE